MASWMALALPGVAAIDTRTNGIASSNLAACFFSSSTCDAEGAGRDDTARSRSPTAAMDDMSPFFSAGGAAGNDESSSSIPFFSATGGATAAANEEDEEEATVVVLGEAADDNDAMMSEHRGGGLRRSVNN